MKKTIKAYLVVVALCLLLLCILTQFFGTGYAYIYFAGWELQTNMWVLFALILMVSFCMQSLYIFAKKLLARRKLQAKQATSFSDLHPYEKLAILWLLDAQHEKESVVSQIFAHSGVLKQIIEASFLYKQQNFNAGHTALEQAPPDAYELKEILYIDALLAQNEQDKAFWHLEALSQHQPSAWLADVKQGYEHAIAKLWGKFALKFPWAYLKTTHYGHLSTQDNTAWLTAILERFDSSDTLQQAALKERYVSLENTCIEDTARENKILWLKILARCENTGQEHERLANHLLDEQFDQEVCFMWFEQHMCAIEPHYVMIEQQIDTWQRRYTDAPIFNFMKWYIYQATKRHAEANQLLTTFPDNVLMNYLRIKSKIQHDEVLTEQLNQLFETNTHFLKIHL
ncbi:heme biosynthesis protein HemY [Acinetobacter rathckeae]|uniref:heme biosynthesis protein HemY n=1 Tax=Acinetobacter rathckeae TaxID=2605272 RepID=UPI0018A25FE9|nr:heme biosynthesis protein HemY [Acinetobacter rathckeae]MBF7688351.1 heme biosynthesis protein HemY [Acinetobacter rathckeae]MBF7695130.1 heme biosynthesis protein HemY [Acinetobacter rathckeae]